MAHESAEDINRAAADWVARADRGLTAAERAALDAWLAADVRRAGAYMRLSAALEAAIMAEAGDAAPVARASRRVLLAGAGALAASIAGVGAWAVLRPVRFDTRKGEKKVVTLDDGSVVTLNTATELEVDYSAERRLVRLTGGEALFDVAEDGRRPFIVRAGDTDVRAVGTSFTVSRVTGRPVEVLVREGVVEVSRPRAPGQGAMRVAANTRAVVTDAAAPVVIARVEPEELGRELAWQQGRLVFAGESLSAAAARFARYSDTRIVVSDPELAGRGVAGVFDANDPVGFAQAAALSLNAHAEIGAGEVRIRR